MSTSTWYRDGTLPILDRTNSPAFSAGSWRGMAWAPVTLGSASRSRRKVRQSNRVRSHATRYQRLPSRTSRCGSTDAGARCTAAIGVVELQALAVPAGLGHRDQNNRIDAGGGLLPWKRNGHRRKCVDSAPERSGHDLDHLAQRPQRGLLNAHNRTRLDRRVQPYADGDGFVVVEQERRKHGARRELVATIYAPTRLDGVAQVSEAVDVTTERPRRDLEASSQVGPRPVAPGLEKGQQAEGARPGRGHLASIAGFRSKTGR